MSAETTHGGPPVTDVHRGAVAVHRVGNAMLVAGTLVLLATLVLAMVRPVQALSPLIEADTPRALALAVSHETVADGGADAVLVVPEDDPTLLAVAGAGVSALPGPVAVLLTPPGALAPEVAAELTRVAHATTVAYVLGDPAVAAAVEARGVTTVAVTGSDPTAVAVAFADQTFGAPGGTSQRLLLTSPEHPRLAGVAAVHGANLGIPVVPVQGAYAGEVVLREVLVVAPAGAVADEVAQSQPNGPAVTRVVDGEFTAQAAQFADLLFAEPRDGDLAERVGRGAVVVDAEDTRPWPALLAAAVAGAEAFDGLDVPLVVLPADAPLPGDVAVATRLRLGTPALPVQPAPLPVTGGGLLVGGLLVGVGAVLRRR